MKPHSKAEHHWTWSRGWKDIQEVEREAGTNEEMKEAGEEVEVEAEERAPVSEAETEKANAKEEEGVIKDPGLKRRREWVFFMQGP